MKAKILIILIILVGLIGGGFFVWKSFTEPEVKKELGKEEEVLKEPSPPLEEKLLKEEIISEKIIEEKQEQKPRIQKCSDGTLYNQCSINRPKYCDNGNLIDFCEKCGCPENFICQNNICKEKERVITGYIRDCSFRVGENIPVSGAKIIYGDVSVSTREDGYFSLKVKEDDLELLIMAEGYYNYREKPSRMVNGAFYLIPNDVYKDLYSVVWEKQVSNPNNWMRKWTRQPEIIVAKEKGTNEQVNTVVSALRSDVFNRMTGGLYSSENIAIFDKLPEELSEIKNRDGKIIIYFAEKMFNGDAPAFPGGSAYSADNADGSITFAEIVWDPRDVTIGKFQVLHELTHAITTGGHINYKPSIVSEVETTPNDEPTEADYKFLNCIYNSPLKRSN